jgi:molecular chaperone DnaJ
MAKRDFYEILGLTKSATQDEIKKAYRKVAMEFHPDRNQGDAAAEEKFKEAAEAYEVLSDPTRKEKYDVYGHDAASRKHNPMEDMFKNSFMDDLFSRFTQQRRKGDNMNLVVKMSLEEIYTGFQRQFKYNRNAECKTCAAKGGTGSKSCSTCGGSGSVVEHFKTQFGTVASSSECPACSGAGSTYETECADCKGVGITQIEDFIDINIPSGVLDGMTMIVPQKGQAIKGGQTGDLVITIVQTPHNIFKRSGNDIIMPLKLDYHQLILGDKVEVTTIDGGKIRITIPALTKVGTPLRVTGKGLPQMDTKVRGDMIFEINITIPEKIEDDERSLIEDLKKLKEKVASV